MTDEKLRAYSLTYFLILTNKVLYLKKKLLEMEAHIGLIEN